MQPKTYTIGKITLTHPAYLILVAGAVVTALCLLASFFHWKNPMIMVGLMVISIFIFAYTCYTTYLTNCTIVGNCNILAWFLAFATIIVMVMNIFRIALVMSNQKHTKHVVSSKKK
jgi:hypothetical protein